ncbi:MAG: glucose-1-phosphate thymidylyltransferase [Ktedonobacterales bacterium]
MKGLILSGGKGTRLRPLTYTRAKQLLPLANKPVLFYAIEALVSSGIRDLGIVVGDTHEEIRATVGDGSRWGDDVRVQYIQQEAPLGLAHAVLTARDFLGGDRFIMFLGDNLIGESLKPIVQGFEDPSCSYHCRILLTPVENPSEFGVAELDALPTSEAIEDAALPDNALRVRRLVEKPSKPLSNLALVGVYCFDSHIIEAAESIKPSARGELEITDAIQWLIDAGYDVRPHLLDGYWIDTGKMEDILSANRQVLATIGHSIDRTAEIDAASRIQGNVTIQAGARVHNSTIRGPAIIGERTHIENAYVGPFSSIYHDVTIEGSEVEYCIVLENSRIHNVPTRIEASLIGRNVEVYAEPQRPRAHKLMLGDYSKVGLMEQ